MSLLIFQKLLEKETHQRQNTPNLCNPSLYVSSNVADLSLNVLTLHFFQTPFIFSMALTGVLTLALLAGLYSTTPVCCPSAMHDRTYISQAALIWLTKVKCSPFSGDLKGSKS